MPEDRIPARRHALLVDVTQAASEVSRLVHEARDLHLPVELASATAARRWSAGPSCSKTSFPELTAKR